jgi:hypothetical protein
MVLVTLIACSSHEELPPPDNPFDPGNPDYVSPSVVIINGPNEGEVLDVTSTSIEWEGNESATEYRYKFDSPDWSEWNAATSHAFDYLDEGNHGFEVQARSVNGDLQETPTDLSFDVNAVAGPSVLVYPYQLFGSPGDTVECQIIAEEVTDVFANEFIISFDNDYLELIEIVDGDILGEWGGVPLIVEELSGSLLSISMVAVEGSSISFSGTSSLVTLLLRINPLVISGTGFEVIRVTDITFLNRNLDNLNVNVNRIGVLHVQ